MWTTLYSLINVSCVYKYVLINVCVCVCVCVCVGGGGGVICILPSDHLAPAKGYFIYCICKLSAIVKPSALIIVGLSVLNYDRFGICFGCRTQGCVIYLQGFLSVTYYLSYWWNQGVSHCIWRAPKYYSDVTMSAIVAWTHVINEHLCCTFWATRFEHFKPLHDIFSEVI